MYVRQNLLVSVVEYQTLELVSESVWLIIMMLSCVNHMACIYRLSTETESGPPPLADAPNHLIFLPTTPKITTGEFILPEFNPVYDYCSTKPNISVPRLHPGVGQSIWRQPPKSVAYWTSFLRIQITKHRFILEASFQGAITDRRT